MYLGRYEDPLNFGGLSAAGAPVLKSTAGGAAMGTAIMPGIGTAIGALLGALVGLGKGIAHASPWGFLYDEYPRKIYEAEFLITQAKNLTPPPDPGGGATPDGGDAYQRSMQAIVPRYVPGSEPLIAAYDRRLNEAGGAYETTYGLQIAEMKRLQGLATTGPLVPPQSPTSAKPASYSTPTSPAPLSTPPSQYGLTDGYGTAVNQFGQPIDPRSGNVYGQPIQQTSMFGDLGSIAPLVIGGVGLLVILMSQKSGNGRGNSSRKR